MAKTVRVEDGGARVNTQAGWNKEQQDRNNAAANATQGKPN